RLKIHALVQNKFVKASTTNDSEARFPTDFFTPFPVDVSESKRPNLPEQLSAYTCLEPFTLLMETVNSDMPTEVDLWQTLRARVQTADKDSVRLYLTPSIDQAEEQLKPLKPRFRNVARCDLIKQAWRWQGRPLKPLPFDPQQWPADASEKDSDPEILKWEAG